MPHRYQIVAGADPIPARVERLRQVANNPDYCVRRFRELLGRSPSADRQGGGRTT